jgi:ATP-dependent Clp protease protease subunit
LNLAPIVIEQTPRGERAYDIYSRLLKERIVLITYPIDDMVASATIAQLLFLQGEDDTEPIYMYINSPGGIITAGMAIYDTMQYVTPEVHTWAIGLCGSFAAVLLAGGAKGHRSALPHTKVVMHQPWLAGGLGGSAADIEIHARDIVRDRQRINEILAQHTGQPLEKIAQDTDRDFIMTAEEARDYGIIDFIADAATVPKPKETA